MFFFQRRIAHLARYFFFLSILIFVFYWLRINDSAALVFIGPCIYLGYFVESLLDSSIDINHTETLKDFAFVLPVTLVYFTALGFLLKQLLNERGFLKIVTVLTLIGFVGFIHVMAWQKLTAYVVPPPELGRAI